MTQPVPAHIQVYVEVLGEDKAIGFLLAFGGTEVHLTQNPGGSSEAVKLLGRDDVIRLAKQADRLPARVPIPRPWIATRLRAKGLRTVEIARKMKATDATVRRWCAKAGIVPGSDAAQLSLKL